MHSFEVHSNECVRVEKVDILDWNKSTASTALVLPCLLVSFDSWIIFLRVYFCMLSRGQGDSTPWISLSSALALALLGNASAVRPPTPSPFFPFLLDPSLLG